MFKNYYLFKVQLQEIGPQICGSTIYSVYTIHKNELIFDLSKDDNSFHLAISINPTNPYILLKKQTNFKGAKFNKFEMLVGQDIKKIELINNNKFIKIELDGYIINSFFYSISPNIVVYNSQDQLIDSFKSLKTAKIVEEPKDIESPKSKAEIKKIILSADKISVKEIIKQIYPAYNNQVLSELYFRLKINDDDRLNNIDKELFFKRLTGLHAEIESGKAYIYKHESIIKTLLLYRSDRFANQDYQIEEFASINKAWDIFNHENQRQKEFARLIDPVLKAIEKRKRILVTTLSKLDEAEDIEGRKQIADLKGNLILSNKHKIPRGSNKVELINIFSEQQERVTIKLNPKKTSVENATYYFQKYKNIAEKKQVIALKKSTYNKELQEINKLEDKTRKATLRDLAKIKEQLEDMNIIQPTVIKEKAKQSLKYAFRRLILENAWDIYIGKNNLNNDLLTFRFANKWDIWLHAQGVSGSHVIIKLPGKNINTPKNIIEQAAQIAAANSKAKHSSTVPVIYTEVRYVSKIRGAQPGTVSVKNEKVIFVQPLNLNQ